VVRVTPFKYYSEVLFLTLKEEKSYDRIPNFTVSFILQRKCEVKLFWLYFKVSCAHPNFQLGDVALN
jgi:hypothetical protein